MGNAQGWTLIGIVATFATLSMTMVVFSFQSLRSEMTARFERLEGVFGARFDGVDRRLDGLDRDVQALSDRVFRDRP
jgi:hypothetical protein